MQEEIIEKLYSEEQEEIDEEVSEESIAEGRQERARWNKLLNFKRRASLHERQKKNRGRNSPWRVLAVWGSPGSGKTILAAKLAKYLADKKKNTVLILCDMTAPMLPLYLSPSDLEHEKILRKYSLLQPM